MLKKKYLEYLYEEIDKVSKDNSLRVLEVGCGNCINLLNLREKYGNRLELFGIDISQKRIETAQKFYGKRLNDIELSQQSITSKTIWDDKHFDVVFSMHCLEQISYSGEYALKEMYRLAIKKIIMIEPVFELGSPLQRLYLYNADHNRILFKTLKDLKYNISRIEPLRIQPTPNQSSIIVVSLP